MIIFRDHFLMHLLSVHDDDDWCFMPPPRFEHSGSDLWFNMLLLEHGFTKNNQNYFIGEATYQ